MCVCGVGGGGVVNFWQERKIMKINKNDQTCEARPNTPPEAGPRITERCQVGQVFSLGLQ